MKIINKILTALKILLSWKSYKPKPTLVESKKIKVRGITIYITDLEDIRSIVMDTGDDNINNITATKNNNGEFPSIEMLISLMVVPYLVAFNYDNNSDYTMTKIYNTILALFEVGFVPDGDGGLVLEEDDDLFIEAIFIRGNAVNPISSIDLILYVGDEDENTYKLNLNRKLDPVILVYMINAIKNDLVNVNDRIKYLVENNLN